MFRWVEGPRERGCEYHQKAVFNFPSANGQIDVFVMPGIVKARPVAITINLTTRTAGKTTLKDAVATRDRLSGLRDRLAPKLALAGIADDRIAAFVNDLIEMLEGEAPAINLALAKARRKS